MLPYKPVQLLHEDRLRDAERQYRYLEGAQYIPSLKTRQQPQVTQM